MQGLSNWKSKAMILGGTAGLIFGLCGAWLYVKNHQDEPKAQNLSSQDGVKLGLGLISLVKQIAEIGKKS